MVDCHNFAVASLSKVPYVRATNHEARKRGTLCLQGMRWVWSQAIRDQVRIWLINEPPGHATQPIE